MFSDILMSVSLKQQSFPQHTIVFETLIKEAFFKNGNLIELKCDLFVTVTVFLSFRF